MFEFKKGICLSEEANLVRHAETHHSVCVWPDVRSTFNAFGEINRNTVFRRVSQQILKRSMVKPLIQRKNSDNIRKLVGCFKTLFVHLVSIFFEMMIHLTISYSTIQLANQTSRFLWCFSGWTTSPSPRRSKDVWKQAWRRIWRTRLPECWDLWWPCHVNLPVPVSI